MTHQSKSLVALVAVIGLAASCEPELTTSTLGAVEKTGPQSGPTTRLRVGDVLAQNTWQPLDLRVAYTPVRTGCSSVEIVHNLEQA